MDRDGVINHDPIHPNRYITKISDLHIIASTIDLIVKLQLNGKQVCVATNQQGLGKGLINLHDLDILHNEINKEIITNGGSSVKFYVCPHLELASCLCRKPMPGLIVKASADFGISKNRILFIGNKLSDSLAATAAEVDFCYMNYQD